MKILLTGASGFLGRHTREVLKTKFGEQNLVCINSTIANLMEYQETKKIILDVKPDVVIHYAAYSGGIGVNKAFPADFYFRNTLLTANMFDVAAKAGVKKLIYPMGGCSYPANAKNPINEEQLWSGYPQEESAGYSTAKMMGLVAAKSYKKQYGLDSTIIIPGNMYGEFDNFCDNQSHVVPAMIRRIYEAKIKGIASIKMWGTGRPKRDFVYAGDVASTIPYFINNYSEVGPINISTGSGVSIKYLAEILCEIIGYSGSVLWDISKPDGQELKVFSTSSLDKEGLSCPTDLYAGLKKTFLWFEKNYADKTDGLRL